MGFISHIKLFKEYLKIAVATALEYRANFVIQVLAMAFNDAFLLVFWFLFFDRFKLINGWALEELMILYALLTLAYGIAGVFFGNRSQIPKLIAEGKLDFYLNLPKEELFHILISKSSSFAVGDIVFGLLLGAYVLTLSQWPLFLLFVVISTSFVVSFGVLVGSLGFYFGNAEETARTLWMGMISLSSNPFSIFKGGARIILLTLIPAGFVTGIPVELLKNFTWSWFGILVGAAVIFLLLSIIIFRRGLRRYESGSMMTARI
ncbi:TPA: hypothetical protein HA241_04865 [Candidatus Woesearchaeota archaeon]|nr:hypothetical protein [Candidatus Woesearchaeota archaeon]